MSAHDGHHRGVIVLVHPSGVVEHLGRAPQRDAVMVDEPGATAIVQLTPQRLPLGARRRHDQRAEQIVQVVGCLRPGRDLLVDARNRAGIKSRDRREIDVEPTPQRHRVGAPVLQLLVIEECVRPSGEDLVGKDRGLRCVDGMHLHCAALDGAQQCAQAIDVERFVERVVNRLAHDQVIGDLDRSSDVLLARGRLREQRRHEVVRLHALDRRGIAATAAEAQDEQRPVEVPPPSRDEHRRIEDGLLEGRLDGIAVHIARHFVEREAVMRPERQHDGVVGRRGLELEVERPAELLAQRETEGAIDPTAVRRVDHQLHAAGLVEEALEDDRLQRWRQTERGAAHSDVVDDHRGGLGLDAAPLHDPFTGAVGAAAVRDEGVDSCAQHRHRLGQFGGAGRCFARPERHRRRRVAGVTDSHDARCDAPNLPGVRAEQEDVAGHRLDGPVLVHAADERVIGLDDDAVVADLGYGAARGQRGETRAGTAADLTVDGIVEHIAAARAPARLHSSRHEVDHLVEHLARQVGVRSSTAHDVVQLVGSPFARTDLGDKLLGENIERPDRELDGVELAGSQRAEQGGALDELVACERIEAAFRHTGP